MSEEDNKEQIKDRLLEQYKAYRNVSLKVAILLGSLAFAGHFCVVVSSKTPATLQLEEVFLQSILLAAAFAALGYCIGSLLGSVMQKRHYGRLREIKDRRSEALQNQISIRESRLRAIEQEQSAVY